MKEKPYEYSDSYPTCAETFATLRIFSDHLLPDEITRLLNIIPTETYKKGEPFSFGKLRRKTNGWFYETEKLTTSKDTRRHIDLILTVLEGKQTEINDLHQKNCKIDIISYYVSTNRSGGGPWLMPQEMLTLGNLGIGIWWDVYFQENETPEG